MGGQSGPGGGAGHSAEVRIRPEPPPRTPAAQGRPPRGAQDCPSLLVSCFPEAAVALSFLGYTPGRGVPRGPGLETPEVAWVGAGLAMPKAPGSRRPPPATAPPPPHRAPPPSMLWAVTVSIPAASALHCSLASTAGSRTGAATPAPGPGDHPARPWPQPLSLHAGATNPRQPWPSTSRFSTTSRPGTPTSCRCSGTRSWRCVGLAGGGCGGRGQSHDPGTGLAATLSPGPSPSPSYPWAPAWIQETLAEGPPSPEASEGHRAPVLGSGQRVGAPCADWGNLRPSRALSPMPTSGAPLAPSGFGASPKSGSPARRAEGDLHPQPDWGTLLSAQLGALEKV